MSLEERRAELLSRLAEASSSASASSSSPARAKKRQRVGGGDTQSGGGSAAARGVRVAGSRADLQAWAKEHGKPHGVNGGSRSEAIREAMARHQAIAPTPARQACAEDEIAAGRLLAPPAALHNLASFALRRELNRTNNGTNTWRPPPLFFKGVKFSPDGRCVLTASEDNTLRLFEVPESLFQQPESSTAHNASATGPTHLAPVLSFSESETIYDYCWYPRMSSASPQTCVFASTSRNSPVHLFDAYTGKIRATYRAYDHYDEIASPISLCFSLDGARLYAGFTRVIRVFDTSRPGRPAASRALCKNRADRTGQRGVVSCMAFNPDWSGLYAVGTYARNIWVYDDRSAAPVLSFENAHSGGGVTQVQWCPDGRTLCSGARTDSDIAIWDVRGGSNHARLATLSRECVTNQRISFDIDEASGGRYLVSGSSSPTVTCYDLKHLQTGADIENEGNGIDGEAESLHVAESGRDAWTKGKRLHLSGEMATFNDAVNGVSIGKKVSSSLLATTTGQRRSNTSTWPYLSSSTTSSDSVTSDESDEWEEGGEKGRINCLQLWRLHF